jgi:hypothetical protein
MMPTLRMLPIGKLFGLRTKVVPMKVKMRIETVDGQVEVVMVELPRLDVPIAVKKAILSLDLDLRDVREAVLL